MNRYLHPGYKFSLDGIEGVFKIKSVIGYGSSCAVYFVEFTDKNGVCTEHLLKEYNPNKLELYRSESGVLFADNDEETENFNSGLLRFEEGYKKQLKIRKLNETKNTTSNIQGIYEGNGTKYIDMTCFNGLTYDKIQESNLYDLLRRTKTIAQTIKHYHNNGFLHLDLKPNNIFTIPESVELVMLFDFDSLLTKNEIMSGSSVSYTEAWAAPELLLPGRKSKICEATDLFSIGEMVFYQLFGRHSSADERRSFAKYEFDYDSAICKGSDPKVFPMLADFLNKTICGVVSKRYTSADEMIERLEQMILLANPHESRIISTIPSLQSFFVGRTCEIEKIHNRLEENDLLFVSGMGGIGKSELVKNFAVQYKDSYDAVIFAPYITDLMMLITDDKSVSIANIERFQGEQPVEYYNRKLRKLNELCDERTLFIIDNFDTAEDPQLNDILTLKCKKIITTRNSFADYNYPQIEIGSLAMRSDINSIFNQYYSKPLDEESQKTVDLIIDLVDGHTMTVELLAKQMKSGRATPQKMLDTLRKGGIGESGKEKVESGKDSNLSRQSAYDHIRALFDISELDENELYILGNLSLIPHSGISTEQFKDWCELDDYETINSLITEGWIRWDEEKDFISLHPVISDIMFELVKEETADISLLLDSFSDFLNNETYFDSLEFSERYYYINLKNTISAKITKADLRTNFAAKFLGMDPIGLEFGNFDLLINFLSKSIEIGKSNSDYPSCFIADTYSNLGVIYLRKDDVNNAEFFTKQSLETYKISYGDNCVKSFTKEIARIHNNLGLLHHVQGNYTDAKKEYIYALELLKNHHNTSNGLAATLYCNLGDLCFDTDYFSEAMSHYDTGLKIQTDIFGEYSSHVASTYFSKGNLFKFIGDYENANKMYTRSVEIRESLLGLKNEAVSQSYNALALLNMEEKDFISAEKNLNQALNIRLSLYGENNIAVANCYHNLGGLYDEIKNNSVAEEYYLKSIKIRENIKIDQSSLAHCYCTLGAFYTEQSLVKKAEPLILKSLTIRKMLLGSEHSETAHSYYWLGRLNIEKGMLSEAKVNLLKALEIQSKIFGEGDSRTQKTQFFINKITNEKN